MGLYCVPGEAIPVVKCSHCKNKFLSYTEVKHLLVQFVPVLTVILHVAPCEETASVPFFSCLLNTGIVRCGPA